MSWRIALLPVLLFFFHFLSGFSSKLVVCSKPGFKSASPCQFYLPSSDFTRVRAGSIQCPTSSSTLTDYYWVSYIDSAALSVYSLAINSQYYKNFLFAKIIIVQNREMLAVTLNRYAFRRKKKRCLLIFHHMEKIIIDEERICAFWQCIFHKFLLYQPWKVRKKQFS